jgi:hypothetical protein
MNESAHPIVEELRGCQPVALEAAREPSGIPAAPGFYAWWLIEPTVIADLQPPFNIDHNASHPFCAAMKAARADCVASAAPWP